jgi:ribose 5-phosphate isomerase A
VNPKQIAAERAVSLIQDGMSVGLGTGSTAAYAIIALGQRLQTEPLRLRCVATSLATEALARQYGIALADWETVGRLDLTIDGADEVDPQYRLIKGGGGALLREKLVATVTDTEVIIVDETKVVPALGAHPVPVVVVPYAWQSTRARLEARFGVQAAPRLAPDGTVFVSDDGCYVLDIAFGRPLPSPDTLDRDIKSLVGVVETGLFLGHCQRLIVGHSDGRIEELAVPSETGRHG